MILLLPERRRFQAATPVLAKLLGRGNRLADAGEGERAQLLRHFRLLPAGWPMAAITRHQLRLFARLTLRTLLLKKVEIADSTLSTGLRLSLLCLRPRIM